jgi:predicted RNA-binding protein
VQKRRWSEEWRLGVRACWLDLFTPKTWREFLDAGGEVSGFRTGRRGFVRQIKPGDYFLCYLTGVSRFVGLLEVVSEPFEDHARIWSEEDFPLRLRTRKLVILEPEIGVPIKDLFPRLSLFPRRKSDNSWQGLVQGSPRRFQGADGELIVRAIRDAEQSPVVRPFDPRKLLKKANRSKLAAEGAEPPLPVELLLPPLPPTAPEAPEPPDELADEPIGDAGATRLHTEMEALLLRLGRTIGLDLWVDAHDRNATMDGVRLGDFPGVLEELASQFSRPLARGAKRIDVLWLREDEVVAAFEVESTTSVFSGLLRLSDLLVLHPNAKIPLYIVAPRNRRELVARQIGRPTFSRGLKNPLPKNCGYISFEKLRDFSDQVERLGLAPLLLDNPERALNTVAEAFDTPRAEMMRN